MIPLEPGEVSLGDELGTILKTKLLLPLFGPLLGAKQSELQLWNIVGIRDLEGVDFSLVL